MSVMRFRKVPVRVRQHLVAMHVGVPRRSFAFGMGMRMMGVVLVFMCMHDGFVRVPVLVRFAQVQPKSQCHQCTRHQQRCRDRFAQPGDGQNRTEERRDGEVGARARGAQVTQPDDEQHQADAIGRQAERHAAGHQRH